VEDTVLPGEPRRDRPKDGAMEATVAHLVQIGGALLVLAAFALAQARVLTPQARVYLILNLVGAAVLAADACVERQWGSCCSKGRGHSSPRGGLLVALRPSPTPRSGR
jgi:hypothetical protein